jgi:hypothetical protein
MFGNIVALVSDDDKVDHFEIRSDARPLIMPGS